MSTNSEGSEHPDSHEGEDHHDTDPSVEESKETIEDEANQSVELEDDHNGIDLNNKNDGYAQVNSTQNEDDSTHLGDEMVKDLNNSSDVQSHPLQNDTQPMQHVQEMPMVNPAMQQNYDPNNTINVMQSCLEGQFKPFIACVQAGFIDKD